MIVNNEEDDAQKTSGDLVQSNVFTYSILIFISTKQ